jgi:hypothetical protein
MLSRVNMMYLRINRILFHIFNHKNKKRENILGWKGQNFQFHEQFPTGVSASASKHDSDFFLLQPEHFYTVRGIPPEQ